MGNSQEKQTYSEVPTQAFETSEQEPSRLQSQAPITYASTTDFRTDRGSAAVGTVTEPEQVQDDSKRQFMELLKSYMTTSEEIARSILDKSIGELNKPDQISCLSACQDGGGNTVIHLAVSQGHVDTLKTLLSALTSEDAYHILKQRNKHGKTAVHEAAAKNQTSVLEFIFQSVDRMGDLVKIKDEFGNIALWYAVKGSSVEAVKVLLECEDLKSGMAAVTALNNKGKTILHAAALKDDINIFQLIVSRFSRENTEKLLLAQDSQRNTVLHHAIMHHCLTLLRYLISPDSNFATIKTVQAQNQDGRTPLHYASAEELKIILQTINEAHRFVILSVQDFDGDTVLMIAAERGDVGVLSAVKSLLPQEAFVDLLRIQNKQGSNSFHMAAGNGCKDFIDYLSTHLQKDDFRWLVGVKDLEGNTPIHIASTKRFQDVLSIITRFPEDSTIYKNPSSPDVPSYDEGLKKSLEVDPYEGKSMSLLQAILEKVTMLEEGNRENQESIMEVLERISDCDQQLREQTKEMRSLQLQVSMLNQQQKPNTEDDPLMQSDKQRSQTSMPQSPLPFFPEQNFGFQETSLPSLQMDHEDSSHASLMPEFDPENSNLLEGGQLHRQSDRRSLLLEVGYSEEAGDQAELNLLETISSQFTSRYEVSIDKEIGRILDAEEAGHHIIVEDPDDPNRLFIIGIQVERAITALEGLTSQPDFKSYSIMAHNVEVFYNGLPLYVHHLMPFQLEREASEDDDREQEGPMNHAMCQLIVKANHVDNDPRTVQEKPNYYGVSVTHSFLSKWQKERLLDSDRYEESIQTEVLKASWSQQWSLRAHNNRNLLKMRGPPLCRYRQYFEDRDKFLQDITLFGLSERQLQEHGWRQIDDTIIEEELSIFRSRQFGDYVVDGIVPITSHDDLARVGTGLVGKRVLVGETEGLITLPPRQAPRDGVAANMQLGLHLTFRTSSRLSEGQSGSMVYVVNKDGRHVYIAGMLIGYLKDFEEISGYTIYQAVAVNQSLEEIQYKFLTDIRNIQPLKNALANKTVSAIVDQLEDGRRP